jgi:hypothetical protein
MKPTAHDQRTGKLTMEQYLGLTEGMNLKVAGRMLALASDYANDVISLHDDALDPRLDAATLTGLARAATHAETRLARLLVLAAENCDDAIIDVPLAIRSNIKTVSRCRSSICRLALTAQQQDFGDQQLAA